MGVHRGNERIKNNKKDSLEMGDLFYLLVYIISTKETTMVHATLTDFFVLAIMVSVGLCFLIAFISMIVKNIDTFIALGFILFITLIIFKGIGFSF